MRDDRAGKDVLIVAAVALIAALGVAVFSRVTLTASGPYGPTVRKSGNGMLLIGDDPRIDLNTASAELLETLNGIGPVLAERIVEYREEHGPFRSIEEIMLVDGIGQKKFEANKDRIAVQQVFLSTPGESAAAPDG